MFGWGILVRPGLVLLASITFVGFVGRGEVYNQTSVEWASFAFPRLGGVALANILAGHVASLGSSRKFRRSQYSPKCDANSAHTHQKGKTGRWS